MTHYSLYNCTKDNWVVSSCHERHLRVSLGDHSLQQQLHNERIHALSLVNTDNVSL